MKIASTLSAVCHWNVSAQHAHSSAMMTVAGTISDKENQYFQEWAEQIDAQQERQERLLTADHARDFDTVAKVLSFRKPFIQKYAHAIPNHSALNTIASYAPIVEMAAGTGYWASLLRAQSVDVLCYDRNPPGQLGAGTIISTRGLYVGRKYYTEMSPQLTFIPIAHCSSAGRPQIAICRSRP